MSENQHQQPAALARYLNKYRKGSRLKKKRIKGQTTKCRRKLGGPRWTIYGKTKKEVALRKTRRMEIKNKRRKASGHAVILSYIECQ